MKLFQSDKEEERKITKAILFLFGFEPININLYKLALLHKSNNKEESNERLEYLGDAVLGLISAQYIFKKFPYKDEGFLTKIRSKIVSRESLNNIGRKIGLKEIINFNSLKESSKSYKSIYGDALEAIIGAVYLDVGFVPNLFNELARGLKITIKALAKKIKAGMIFINKPIDSE